MKQQPLERITFKHIIEEILKVLNFKRGLLLTCKDLIIRPHQVLDTYLNKNRKHYTSPIQFSALWIGLWALFINFFSNGFQTFSQGFKDGALDNKTSTDSSKTGTEDVEQMEQILIDLVDGFMSNQNIFQFALIPLAALLTYWFYRKAKWYYTEHIVLNAYMTGVVSMIGILFLPFEYISIGLGIQIGAALGFGYFIWSWMDVFQQKNFKGFLWTFVLIFLYYTVMMFFMFLVAMGYLFMRLPN